jgi:hypothetical protein
VIASSEGTGDGETQRQRRGYSESDLDAAVHDGRSYTSGIPADICRLLQFVVTVR